MEKNSADSPLDQAIEQYKRDLMAVYRRSRTLERLDRRSSEQQPTPSAPAQPPEDPPAPTHDPDLSRQEPEKTADAPLPEPEDPDEPPENSGTPKDAIGCDEAKYLAAAGEFLRQLLDQDSKPTPPTGNTHHTTNDENFQPSSAIKEEYEQFQLENPASGTIKTQVFTARGAYPVEQAQVDLYKVFPDGDYLISRQYTDRSGQVNPVTVPVYQRSLSESPGDSTPYVSYRIAVTHPGFADAVIEQVPVFEGVTSLQSVNLIPMAATPSAPDDSTESN